jgi:hypothetical protein
MPIVEFTKDNAMKCLCGGCPVQTQSACVAEKSAALKAAMETGMEGMPTPDALAGLYCATGTAACDDLDFSQSCHCMSCPVYSDAGLTQWKYCERGAAAAIG